MTPYILYNYIVFVMYNLCIICVKMNHYSILIPLCIINFCIISQLFNKNTIISALYLYYEVEYLEITRKDEELEKQILETKK